MAQIRFGTKYFKGIGLNTVIYTCLLGTGYLRTCAGKTTIPYPNAHDFGKLGKTTKF